MTVAAPDEEAIWLQVTDESRQAILFDHELNGREMYVLNGEPASRPSMGLIYKVDETPVENSGFISLTPNAILRVENIPTGSVVTHATGELVVDDGYIEWSAVMPGSYSFRITNFPLQEIELNAIVG